MDGYCLYIGERPCGASPLVNGSLGCVEASPGDLHLEVDFNSPSMYRAEDCGVYAEVPAMERKGRIQVGMDADITVFDPETITDRATIDNPAEPAEGVEFLIVSGSVVVAIGDLDTDVLPGRPVRNQ